MSEARTGPGGPAAQGVGGSACEHGTAVQPAQRQWPAGAVEEVVDGGHDPRHGRSPPGFVQPANVAGESVLAEWLAAQPGADVLEVLPVDNQGAGRGGQAAQPPGGLGDGALPFGCGSGWPGRFVTMHAGIIASWCQPARNGAGRYAVCGDGPQSDAVAHGRDDETVGIEHFRSHARNVPDG